jgi:hypothetical protein
MFEKRKYVEFDELVKYLNEPPLNYDIDILTYWKVNILIFCKVNIYYLYIIYN